MKVRNIGPVCTLYFLKLLSENTTKSNNGSILNAFDYYILPVLNVDGHEYSQTEDRMWRKTRSYDGQANSCCYGVDLNRNWDVNWQGIKYIDP
jgi:murein tripeptide amidase MpaA